MNEIKFKAFIKEGHVLTKNKIVDVLEIDFEEEEIVFETKSSENAIKMGAHETVRWCTKFKNIVLLQYTGLKDKNNVEIYEGDIIHSGDNEELELKGRRGYVFFEDGCFDVERRKHKVPYNHDKYIPYLDWPSEAFEVCKVIGNIYENGDLLK